MATLAQCERGAPFQKPVLLENQHDAQDRELAPLRQSAKTQHWQPQTRSSPNS
jgi:hypothetical protein